MVSLNTDVPGGAAVNQSANQNSNLRIGVPFDNWVYNNRFSESSWKPRASAVISFAKGLALTISNLFKFIFNRNDQTIRNELSNQWDGTKLSGFAIFCPSYAIDRFDMQRAIQNPQPSANTTEEITH